MLPSSVSRSIAVAIRVVDIVLTPRRLSGLVIGCLTSETGFLGVALALGWTGKAWGRDIGFFGVVGIGAFSLTSLGMMGFGIDLETGFETTVGATIKPGLRMSVKVRVDGGREEEAKADLKDGLSELTAEVDFLKPSGNLCRLLGRC